MKNIFKNFGFCSTRKREKVENNTCTNSRNLVPEEFVGVDFQNSSINQLGFSMNRKGELYRTVITSKLLISEDTEIEDSFVSNNLHKDIDYSWFDRTKANATAYGYNKGNCPNIYIGSSISDIHEIFQPTTTISVKIKEHDIPLKISINDLPKFTNPIKGGAFGSVYFLEDLDLKNDHLSKDNNRGLKEELVVKKQIRNTIFGTNRKGETCFAFNELTIFLFDRLRTDKYHSDQYVDHFYALSAEDPKKLELFIIMKRCLLMIDGLISFVHGENRTRKNFKTNKKFPTSILKNLIYTFFTQSGHVHNDIKGDNMGYVIEEDGTVVCRFIDFGSKNGNGEREPTGAKYSKFPSTVLFLAPNKTPRPGSDITTNSGGEDNKCDLDILEELETLKTTCKRALPNYRHGAGDNLWAMAILILECIFGFNPVTEYGLSFNEIFRCIHEKEFYIDFKESDSYKNNYQSDDDFEVVDDFLKRGLVKGDVVNLIFANFLLPEGF